MEDYSAYPERMSARTYARMKAKEDSGQSAKVDYFSHPLDKAPVPEPEPEPTNTKTKTTTAKKTAGKAAPARAKVEKKPTTTRKKTANATPRKRSGGSITLKLKPRSPAEETIAEAAVPENTQGQKTTDAVSGEINTARVDSDSELSELATTPEWPTPDDFQPSESLDIKSQLDTGDAGLPNEPSFALPVPSITEANPILGVSEASNAPVLPSPSTPGLSVAAQADEEIPSQLAPPGPPVPITPTSLRHSGRSRAQPTRFGDVIPTPADLADSEDERAVAEVQDETIFGGDSPTVLKVSRKKRSPGSAETTAKPARRKNPVSQEKLSADDLADDVPATKSRKRKAESSETTPRKRPSKTKDTTEEASEVDKTRKTPVNRKAPVQRIKKERTPVAQKQALQLPSPPMSQSDYLEASGFPIDPDLLRLSRALTHREPLGSKPEPCGKPEVWAPGRQELCETLPYYKSAHSGCYATGGSVYAFMFDSAGMGREYMDEDVVIARMGGGMDTDAKTGVLAQAKDHHIDAVQPRSLFNNITHKNPLPIICGSRNTGAPTSMPHRYCVLDWFKPTHIWAEMTMGKKGPIPTIRYRFERLNTAKPSWYAPASPLAIEKPSDLVLHSETCNECLEECPQVYLIGWVCTNSKCVALWKLSNGQNAPCGDLDYHPAFLLHRTKWKREDPPFNLNPGVPQIGDHIGDNLTMINTRGVVCPNCGRCNPRYKFTHWRCDTAGCDWNLTPKHHLVVPANLSHTPWDITSDGPSLIKTQTAPIVRTQVKYRNNYKIMRYTFEGIAGSVIVAKANKHVVSEPGGPDDMFRELQLADLGLERRMLRETADVETNPVQVTNASETSHATDKAAAEVTEEQEESDDEHEHDHKAQVGNRMTAFGMNYGMPYKFIASGNSQSFEEAPAAIRAARSRLNFAQRDFVNEPAGYQDFNEELVFAYYQSQMIKYHDDGEKGLGPRIATLSLGAPATMTMRVKAKYHSQVSNTGVFTYEKPLPLPLLESSFQGFKSKPKATATTVPKCYKETHARRVAAWEELQTLKDSGDSAGFRNRSKEIAKDLKLKRAFAQPILSFHLTHGDIVMMEGEDIQKFLEHQVEPAGNLRYALTCRTILENHLTPDQLPKYKVMEAEVYDGSGIREEGDEEALVWD